MVADNNKRMSLPFRRSIHTYTFLCNKLINSLLHKNRQENSPSCLGVALLILLVEKKLNKNSVCFSQSLT